MSQSDRCANQQSEMQRTAEHDRATLCCLCYRVGYVNEEWERCPDGDICPECVDICVESARRCLAEADAEAARDRDYEAIARQMDDQLPPWWQQQDSEPPF